MTSLKFPKIFRTSGTETVEDLEATTQNLKILLRSEKGELLGDPYFGVKLKSRLFEQNSPILKDLIIDDIYIQLALFIPQLKVERKDIKIIQDPNDTKSTLHCTFKALNLLDYTTNMYSISLMTQED